MSTGARRVQKRALDPLGLELQAAGSCLTWGLDPALSPARAAVLVITEPPGFVPHRSQVTVPPLPPRAVLQVCATVTSTQHGGLPSSGHLQGELPLLGVWLSVLQATY